MNDLYKQLESSLYKNTQDGTFYLLLERGNYNEKEFLKVSNMMLEYSSHIKTTPSTLAYIKEHYECEECHKYFILENDEYIEVSYDSLIIKYESPTSEITSDRDDPDPSKDIKKKGLYIHHLYT